MLPNLGTNKSDFTANLDLGKLSNQTRYAYEVGVLPSEPYSGAFRENDRPLLATLAHDPGNQGIGSKSLPVGMTWCTLGVETGPTLPRR